jgi:diguanylate cyclase (GGDEF)-like protein
VTAGAPWPQRHRTAATLVALFTVVGIGALDARVGPRFGFSIFYLVPVVVAGWTLGRRPALWVAITAGGAWMIADALWRTGEEVPALVWNAATRFAIFIGLAWMTARLRWERENLLAANDRLRGMVAREALMARTDSLTGLPNWQGFNEHLTRELARSRRHGTPLAVAYADLDHFKAINDRHGHEEGNTALRTVADALRESVRATDIPARTGGDEFAILLPDANAPAAQAVAERIVQAVTRVGATYPGCGLGVSIGVACVDTAPEGPQELLRQADAAMYRAKHRGKGCVEVVAASERVEDPPPPPVG